MCLASGGLTGRLSSDMNDTTCSTENCATGTYCKGLCRIHYDRARKGQPAWLLTGQARLEKRFWSKVNKGVDCWEWTAGKNLAGYGRMQVFSDGKHRAQLAHRIAYELVVGPIPPGLGLDHRCHNHACVNPDHLRPATAKENLENLTGAFSTSKSGVRGVSWSTRSGKWRGTITHNKKHISVGAFDTISEAEAAVIAKRLELFTRNDVDRRAA